MGHIAAWFSRLVKGNPCQRMLSHASPMRIFHFSIRFFPRCRRLRFPPFLAISSGHAHYIFPMCLITSGNLTTEATMQTVRLFSATSVLAVLLQFPTSGDAFVKKLLEARLMASMMKDLNAQPMASKYMPYAVPVKFMWVRMCDRQWNIPCEFGSLQFVDTEQLKQLDMSLVSCWSLVWTWAWDCSACQGMLEHDCISSGLWYTIEQKRNTNVYDSCDSFW